LGYVVRMMREVKPDWASAEVDSDNGEADGGDCEPASAGSIGGVLE
jgi:hypothetical protein